MEKKKILVIGPSMALGGVERSLLGLLDSFDYEKYEVDLFLLSHSGELMKDINKNVNLLKENKIFSLAFQRIPELYKTGHFFVGTLRVLSYLKGKANYRIYKQGETGHCAYQKIAVKFINTFSKEYDLAIGFLDPHFILQEKVNAKKKIGWVHTDWNKLYKDGLYVPAPDMWKKLDYIACVSEEVQLSFNDLYPQYAYKTIIVENVLSDMYVRSRAKAVDVSSEIDKSCYSVLSVGRFSPQKNFLNAIRVCKILKDQKENIKWYFIGFGSEEQGMKNLISRLSLEDTAIILGKKENPYPYMMACDLYAQPSVFEGKAVTVREAQILGKPVLITDYPTARSQVMNNYDGRICTMELGDIASNIMFMKENPQYCDSLSVNCLSEDYSNSDSTAELLTFVGL